MAKKRTAGQRMIASAKEALAFVHGEDNGCIATVTIRKKINMSQIKEGQNRLAQIISLVAE